MRLGMSRTLERGGLEVTRCEDGRSALAALQARNWHAMVTDVRMPGLDGQQLLSQALELRPRLHVVMVTAFGTVEDAVMAIRRGAHDYLLKPFAPEALLAAVRRALDTARRSGSSSETDGYEPPLIGRHPQFRELLDQAERAARTDATVLITGESGSGKEVVARFIHRHSARCRGPFVAVNCAALPPELLEAELFGVRRGAYTGADRDREGHFERADGGTLLLDELGDCPLPIQAKLLRALEEKAVVPLGAGAPRSVDLRVIAATHQDLVRSVAEGLFRQDLYFRLRVIPLEVPPLRERPADIGELARHLTRQIARSLGRPTPRLSREAIARLARHPWPGNVRELRNVIERAVILDRHGEIGAEDLFLDAWDSPREPDRLEPGMTIAQAEKRLIEQTLEAAGGNRTRASKMLGISVRTLRNKLRTFREQGGAVASSADQVP
ncbi:MAG: sigma-54-dependent Fis family transcriptional regulator [Acidobacteriota bacterium]|nr:MAG: sigma-54-dependent Fis family transcriptional regulator [Acidobacteriota bacterium]